MWQAVKSWRLQTSTMLQLVQQMIIAKRIIDFGMVNMALASASTEATHLSWVEKCILLANHAFLACWHHISIGHAETHCRVEKADVVSITAMFFLLVLLAATQDIAVDGWALTLLSRKNVG